MFRRAAVILLAVAALALAVPAVHAAPVQVTVGGGMSIPTGDFADGAKSGYQFGGAVDYSLSPMFSIGIDGTWNSNEHKDVGSVEVIPGFGTFTLDEDKFTISQFGAHARVNASTSGAIKPYGVFGLGFYNLNEDYKYTFDDGVNPPVQFTNEDDEAAGFFEQIGSRFGGRIGGGANYQLNPTWAIGLELNYHYISMDKDKTGISSANYVGVTAGLSYYFGQAAAPAPSP